MVFPGGRRARPQLWQFCLVSLWLAACASHNSYRPPVAPAAPLSITAGAVFAPTVAAERELELLARQRGHGAVLRRAWLELQCRRPQSALDLAAEVIYGAEPPSPNAEAFARYLRAEAYAQLGQRERGAYDRERARELAIDPELQRRLQAAPPPAVAKGAAPADAALPLRIQPRSAWEAAPPDLRDIKPMGKPNRLTIHHSAVYFRDTRPATCAAQIQRVQRDHQRGEGWSDIGYHFLIDPAGRIWQGRELRWQGAHAGDSDSNERNIGICLLGNFMRNRNGQQPTTAQLAAMKQLVGSLSRRYQIGSDAIHCHSDFKATDCPGQLLRPVVVQLARELAQQAAIVADRGAGAGRATGGAGH